MSNTNNKQTYNNILKTYFGYDELKELQYEIIENCISGNDTVALLPTSYGKSICYQLPCLITKKNVIVVSPLISLMEDQKKDLQDKNIDVICLNSNNKTKNTDMKNLEKGDGKIVYTTPEFLIGNKEFIEKLVTQDKLALIAIDEAHSLSNWGHSFRSDYRKLDFFKDDFPTIPILALTATATNAVINDIATNLKLKNPKIIKHSVDRDNLYIEVAMRDDNIDTKIVDIINKYGSDGRVIIYCKTTNKTDSVAENMKKLGLKCESYHGKKTSDERMEIQKKFTENVINVVVSTIAFGMGINIPDIRVVIHYNCSNDIESYMQEIGRAGRDGKQSYCYMFYNNQDFMMNYTFLNDITNFMAKKQKENDINYLKKYVISTECRRKILLKYFNENIGTDNCKGCDNCMKQKDMRDFTQETLLLFTQINSLTSNIGINTHIKLLHGSKDKTISKFINFVGRTYGKGKEYNDDWWKQLVVLLVSKEYLIEHKIKLETGFMRTCVVLKLSQKGSNWYNDNNREKMLLPISTIFKEIDKTEEESEFESVKKEFEQIKIEQIKKCVVKKKVEDQ